MFVVTQLQMCYFLSLHYYQFSIFTKIIKILCNGKFVYTLLSCFIQQSRENALKCNEILFFATKHAAALNDEKLNLK